MKKIDFNKIYNKNCLEGMKLIDKNKIDLIITDPPFAIDFKAKKANYNRKSSRVIEGYNEILPENYSQFSWILSKSYTKGIWKHVHIFWLE